MTDDPAGTPINSGSTTTSWSGGSTLRVVNALLRRRRAILGCGVATAALAVGATLLSPDPPPRVIATFRAPPSVAAAISELATREGDDDPGVGLVTESAPQIRVSRVAEPDVWRLAVAAGGVERSRELARRLLQAGRDASVSEDPEWLVDAWNGLRDAEAQLERFVDENPDFETSPPLRTRVDRLEGRIELQGAIVVEAERRALLRRVDTDPSATGVDELMVVEPPTVESSGGILYPAALGLVIGSLLGALWVLARQGMTGLARGDPEAYDEFRELMGRARRDLSRPWEIFRRSP